MINTASITSSSQLGPMMSLDGRMAYDDASYQHATQRRPARSHLSTGMQCRRLPRFFRRFLRLLFHLSVSPFSPLYPTSHLQEISISCRVMLDIDARAFKAGTFIYADGTFIEG